MKPYYHQNRVSLYHGDYRDVLPVLGMADHVITDPPYDDKTHNGAMTETTTGVEKLVIDFDPLLLDRAVPLMLSYALRWTIAFCSLEMIGSYRRLAEDAWVRAGFWRRSGTTPQFSGDRPGQPGEGLAIMHRTLQFGRKGSMRWNGGGRSAFYDYPTVKGEARVHPTQKPDRLMAMLILDFTDEDEMILDPFAGSGTTLLEAVRLRRRAIGIEINEAYCEIAAQRLARQAQEITLFP